MPGFAAVGQHAVGELITGTFPPVILAPVSVQAVGGVAVSGSFMPLDNPILWDDGTPILWDGSAIIGWDN